MIRVFLLDDHELVRRGIAALLSAEPDIEVVGEAATTAQARTRIAATLPDIAVLDVQLPDGNGIDLCRDLRSQHPELGCLMLTAFDDDDAISAAVLAGAAGYVLKDIRGSGLIDSIRAVAAGRVLLSRTVTKRVVQRLQSTAEADPRLGSLNPRERQVLTLIADGLTNREIGVELSLAEKTVKNYVSGLLSKLGLQRRTQAAIFDLQARTRDA
ncbi:MULTISPECIES: response regulator [Subtercola]|uniref:DNA-binding response regulator n=1 Tax=Subtercola vilae TaxID=2056433 RepID=A0A4T2C869_9MICO|nr:MULTISPECIES: response regulator transcription factor [Subtercola]MEA9983816.1 response regulator transcription factor [Subtercola sp. RTI3]TIH40643.1 DNA-binding response regulator [Subtercola vilae]